MFNNIQYPCTEVWTKRKKERKKEKKRERERKKEEKEGEKEQFYNAKRHSNNYHMFISRINARQ